ncbi:MAG: paraquat-inducible protein A [Thiotrichales bacterium]
MAASGTPLAPRALTAHVFGLIACRGCHKLLQRPRSGLRLRCPRCGAPVHSRIPNSVARTWALLIAAMLLYIPANTLPVMSVVMLGRGEPDTILSGVQQLILAGLWPLALIVFVASIFVPVLKLAILSGLLWSVRRGSGWRQLDRTRLFRLTEFVGRWSMVDIFVIAILAALVQFGNLASIEAGPGSLSFAAVVVLTMFAANSFDPRLIWDPPRSTPP